MSAQTDVALILWNPDVIQWVSFILLQQNLKCCGIEPSAGPQKMEEMIASHRPSVVVFSLAPPLKPSGARPWCLLVRFLAWASATPCAHPTSARKAARWRPYCSTLQKSYEGDVIVTRGGSKACRA